VISIRLQEGQRVFVKFETLADDMVYEMGKALWEVGVMVRNTLRKQLTRGKRSGLLYRYNGRNLRASAEGEFPQRRSGNLRNSVSAKVISNASVEVAVNAGYAKTLERKNRLLLKEVIEMTYSEQRNILEKTINAGVKRK